MALEEPTVNVTCGECGAVWAEEYDLPQCSLGEPGDVVCPTCGWEATQANIWALEDALKVRVGLGDPV
jgi:hypothetical protein